MASNINSSVINNLYPIAGQDNSTQGFRDNFTYIKNGLSVASLEITELQDRAILKSPLANVDLDNDFNNTPVSNMRLIAMRETVYNFGQISGPIDLDFSVAHVFKLETVGSVVVGFLHWPQQSGGIGVHGTIKLCIQVADTSHVVILPASVNVGKTGVSGIVGNTINFPSTGYYEIVFSSSTGGVSVMLESISMPPNYFTVPLTVSGEQLLEDGGVVSFLEPHSSFSTTTSNKTATMPISPNGTTKTLVMTSAGTGHMTITVANPGWSTSMTGTIRFDSIGQTCTLRVISQKWYVVSQHGVLQFS